MMLSTIDRNIEVKCLCRLCQQTSQGETFVVREMMFGTREKFKYWTCSRCGSVQIVNIPSDLGRHYPDNYYSMTATDAAGDKSLPTTMRKWLVKALYRLHALGIRPLNTLLPQPRRGDYAALIAAQARKTDNILDVGCGADAYFLRFLADLGFGQLSGADPFIQEDAVQIGKIRITRRYLSDVDGEYDIVMLNHSFEHVPEPLPHLQEVKRILRPGGRAIIRIPMISSAAYETYGADWVQLDAPRHLNLPSRSAMLSMICDAGLKLVKAYDDSTELQFYGSELYRRDIPFLSAEASNSFGAEEMAGFRARAVALNSEGRGDQATYILTR